MNEIKYVCRKRFEHTCTSPCIKRRCLKSQPVRFVDQFPVRRKTTLASTVRKNKCLERGDKCKRKECVESDSLSDIPRYPDIYIDPDKEHNCITTVRKTCSKIRWPQSPKPSRYHKKCSEKENFCNTLSKKPKHRTTVISDGDIEDILIRQLEAKQKFYNDCYCTAFEKVVSENHHESIKPLLVSDNRTKRYTKSALKKARALLDYEPESEFLQQIQKSTTPAHCRCNECLIKRLLDNTMKYTDRRELIEKACPAYPVYVQCYCKACQTNKNIECINCDKATEIANDLCMPNVCTEIKKKHAKQTQTQTQGNSVACEICLCAKNKMCSCDLSTEFKIRKHKAAGSDTIQCKTMQSADMPCLDKSDISMSKKIRENNYFDTHCVESLCKNLPSHKCIHKYELDERLLPKPVNTDVWGQSRCELCNKPMTSQNLNISDKKFPMPSTSILTNSNYSVGSSSRKTPSTLNAKIKVINSSMRDLQKVPSCKSQYMSSDKMSNFAYLHERLEKNSCVSENSKHSAQVGSRTCLYTNTGTSATKPTSRNILTGPKLSSECRKINFSDNDTVVELDTSSPLMENKMLGSKWCFEKDIKNKMRPSVIPCNSLALRYQKGVF